MYVIAHFKDTSALIVERYNRLIYMHFLKCTNCGFLNEVKTEYLTFCTLCNMKLSNNFREWRIKHQSKSFIDFQVEICISQIQLDRENEQKIELQLNSKKESKQNIYAATIIVITTLISIFVAGSFIQSIPVGNELAGLAQYMSTLIIGGLILIGTIIINTIVYKNSRSLKKLIWISLCSIFLISLISWNICIR
jgi:hypothetical protein